MKLSTNHNLYEVYCDYDADIAIVDHKPTEEDLLTIVKLKNWFKASMDEGSEYPETIDCEEWSWMRNYLEVGKLPFIFTS